jgi:predicted HicB family RNase H-like nuclease
MSNEENYSLRLSQSLKKAVAELAKQDSISMNTCV